MGRTQTLATGEANPFRRYRQAVYAIYFAFVGLTALYLVASVGAWLYQRHQAKKGRHPIGDQPRIEELLACQGDVERLFRDVSTQYQGIATRLAQGALDVRVTMRETQSDWRRRWREVGRHCRFIELSGRRMPPGFDTLAAAYMDLEELDIGHAALLGRFARQLAARVDETRRSLEVSRRTLEEAATRRGPHDGVPHRSSAPDTESRTTHEAGAPPVAAP